MLPYKIFGKEVERSLYVDTNCNILTSMIFDTLDNSNKNLLIPIHFSTSCLYEELEWYQRHHPEQNELSTRLRNMMLLNGFPKKYGMNENNLIYRVHSDKKVEQIMTEWWELLRDYVPRDQLSLSYVLWENDVKVSDIALPNARIDLKNFCFYPHTKGK